MQLGTASKQGDRAGTESAPSLVPSPGVEPHFRLLLALVVAVCLLPRALVFLWNENYYGDAVIRTELAERWLSNPHWIVSMKDGVFQFGPLHIYLLALFLKLWPQREHAGRLLSLVAGTATVIPLFFLTRRLFGWREGLWAALAFSVWGLHLQFSTTAASEGLALLLVLSALVLFAKGYDEARLTPLAYAALFLNLACATRYDSWALPPLLAILLLGADRDRVAAATRAIIFFLLCLPFPLLWMQGNEVATGSPVAPLKYIDQFHRAWVADGVGRYGELGYRLHNLFFWPVVALFTLTPLVGLFGLTGAASFWRKERKRRWIVWTALVPTAYFTWRGAVLLNFSPVARFAATQIVLLLPFVAEGFRVVSARLPPVVGRALAALSIVSAVSMPVWLGLYTFRSEGKIQNTLRPVSPTSTNLPGVTRAAQFIKRNVLPNGGAIILDRDPSYLDLQIAFYGGLPEERMARYRWEIFPERLRTADPHYLIRFDGGDLAKDPEFEQRGHRVRLGEKWFTELDGFSAPVHVYSRQD